MSRKERAALQRRHAGLSVLDLRLYEAQGALRALIRDAGLVGEAALASTFATMAAILARHGDHYGDERVALWRQLHREDLGA